jgi:adenylosuccinate synthase
LHSSDIEKKWEYNETVHQQLLLLYADDVNLLGDNTDCKKKTVILIDASKNVGLDVKTGNSAYVTASSPKLRTKL